MRLLLAALLASAAFGQDLPKPRNHRAWWASVAAVAVASAVDIHTSRGGIEMNPVLGRGPFGARQAGIKIGLTTGLILAERLAFRGQDAPKPFIVGNYVLAGSLGAVAYHNYRVMR